MDGMSMPMATPTPTTAGIASASFVHFGFGDPFLASFLTPVNMAGYFALLFLMATLSLARVLSIASDKADKKWRVLAHIHPAESGPGSGSWMEKDEEKQLEI